MDGNYYIMEDFVEEISSLVFPQLGVIEVDRFSVGLGPALVHQWKMGHKENNVHYI
jgi:hypothetical protein